MRRAISATDRRLTNFVYDTDESGWPGWRWVGAALRDRPLRLVPIVVAYAAAFALVAGPSGARVSMATWLRSESVDAGLLLGYVAISLLVGLASASIGFVLAGLPRSAPDIPNWPPSRSLWAGLATARWSAWRAWGWLVGLAWAWACAGTARLLNDVAAATKPSVFTLIGLTLLGPAAAVGLTRVGSARRAAWMGIFLGFGALIIRVALPLLSGNVHSGSVGSLALGEGARAVAAVGTALALTGVGDQVVAHVIGKFRWRDLSVVLLARLLPSLLMVLCLIAMQDLGPAVILMVTIVVLTLLAFGSELWWLASLFATGGTMAAVGLGLVVNRLIPGVLGPVEHVQDVVDQRLAAGDCSDGRVTQACKSLRILHVSGLWPQLRAGTGQPSGSTMVRHLEVATSDYAITTMSAWVGMAAAVALLLAVLAAGLRLFLLAIHRDHGNGSSVEIARLRMRIGATVGLQLGLPAALLGLAILVPRFPGTSAKWPLTGLDVPFIAANGMSAMIYASLVSIGVLLARAHFTQRAPVHDWQGMTGSRRAASIAGRAGTFGVALAVVGGSVWIHLGWGSVGSTRLRLEALQSDVYTDVRTRDNLQFSTSNAAGTDADLGLGDRTYPHPALAVDLGYFLAGRSANGAVGLEWLALPALTCGDYHQRGVLDLQAECAGSDVVATVDAAVQREAAALAREYAPGGARADVVLVERATGAITALASSDAEDPAMQALVQRQHRVDGWNPPTLLRERDPESGTYQPMDPARADPKELVGLRARFGLSHLQEPAIRCVTPKGGGLDDDGKQLPPRRANPRRPDEPWNPKWPEDLGPGRGECAQDKADLLVMRPWYEATAPGSTFKVVSALTAVSQGTEMPPDGLGSPLRSVEGQPLDVPLFEREGLSRCGKQTIDWMLLQSCNTTAGWLGVRVGWDALTDTAARVGFGPQAGETYGWPGGAVAGPADPRGGIDSIGSVYYETAQVGRNPVSRTAMQADGDERPLTPAAVARATAAAAIGQDDVRASVLDMAGLTHAIVGAGPVVPGAGEPDSTDYAEPPVLNMVAGTCNREGVFLPTAYPKRSVGADNATLKMVRRGMWYAVHHSSGTANRLAPDGDDGATAAGIDRLTAIWAKSGSADLGSPRAGAASTWARWIMGATDDYVFAARVEGLPDGGGPNPATALMDDLLTRLRALSAPMPVADVCTSEPAGEARIK